MACPIGVMLSDNPGATVDDCVKKLSVARDIVDVIGGKWKMEIILALLTVEKRRFKELQKDLPGISSRVLSAALKDLEDHHILYPCINRHHRTHHSGICTHRLR